MNNDITMCQSTSCNLSTKCLRHEDSGVKPNPKHQSYTIFQPDNCEYFLEKFVDVVEPGVSVWKINLYQV